MESIQNNDLGYAIGRTARILYRLLDGNLRSLVLSFSQVNVLGYLAAKHARGEECTQKLIATECCSTRPSSVTGLLQALERQGYIERRAGEDARVKCVALTERDVVRHPLVMNIIAAYEKKEKNSYYFIQNGELLIFEHLDCKTSFLICKKNPNMVGESEIYYFIP